MQKSNSNSFIIELKLKSKQHQNDILNKRFEVARKMYNSTLSYALKQYNLLREKKEYQNLLSQYFKESDEKLKKLLSQNLNILRQSYNLTEYGLHSYIVKLQNNYKTHIDSNTSQKIASTVWKAISSVIFGKGKKVQFKKYGQLDSVEGKTNKSGIRFRDNQLIWNSLTIPVKIRKNDLFIHESLDSHNIKYCRIVRKIIRSQYVFYLQLVMEGIPPTKKINSTGEFRHYQGIGCTGIDPGVSTIAVVSDKDVFLQELGTSEIDAIKKKLIKNQNKLDRSQRAMNPTKYNIDGTINRNNKDKWIRSNNYIKTLFKVKEFHRLSSVKLKESHNKLANKILTLGDEIYTEEMNYKALAKRAKKTTISRKTGKYKCKKRFGKSINNKAPAMLYTIIDRKLKYIGKALHKVDTRKFKASQYNHHTDSYKKKKLSQRWTTIGNHKVQRDLYSAFLLKNSNENLTKTNKLSCIATFDDFIELHNKEIIRLKNSSDKLPTSYGIKTKVV